MAYPEPEALAERPDLPHSEPGEAPALIDNGGGGLRARFNLGLLIVLLPMITLPVAISWQIVALDWASWTDWKDSVYWPLFTATSTVLGLGAVQSLGWRYFRVPLATPAAVLATGLFSLYLLLDLGDFAGFPANFIWTATLIPTAMLLDGVLVLTGSVTAAGFLGAFAYGALFYVANSILIAPFLQPVVWGGRLLTVADLQAFEYVRSSSPEYLRQVQVGGLHAFPGQVSVIASLFTGLACIALYWTGVGAGRLLVVWPLGRFIRGRDRA